MIDLNGILTLAALSAVRSLVPLVVLVGTNGLLKVFLNEQKAAPGVVGEDNRLEVNHGASSNNALGPAGYLVPYSLCRYE
jgi:hypothetical protein